MKNFFEKKPNLKTSRFSLSMFYVRSDYNPQLSLEDHAFNSSTQPNLLPGEIVIKEAQKVLLCSSYSEKKKGVIGNLFITNFRIFLIPTLLSNEKECRKQKNCLLGEYGVCLSNIEIIYHIVGNKARKLFPGTTIAGRVKGLQLVCKNMRVLYFSFEESHCDDGKNVAKTLLHHVFPGRHALLFAYEFSEPATQEDPIFPTVMFKSEKEWTTEVKRTCMDNLGLWRVSSVNNQFRLSIYLPEWIVIPKSLVDGDVVEMSRAFRSDRSPTWSWSHSNGAALVRMADCLPAITERIQENKFMENIRGMHSSKQAPVMIELDQLLPSVREIQTSFIKFRELCLPESKRQFEAQDNKFYTQLENCKWLSFVSACLRESVNAANHLKSGISVVLQEGDGRDLSAIVASLVQVLLDASSRTIAGFQSLIQKEWIAMGHPFCSRLGFIKDTGNEQSPVFLLFLDSVWQLQRQFNTSFEFSETYLTTVFDSCHISVFDTFLFDCERERSLAQAQENLILRSVWHWRTQFDEDDIVVFRNPLYQIENLLHSKNKKEGLNYLEPAYQVHSLDPWAQCYFRWLPALGIRRGGSSQADLIHHWFRKSIDQSLNELKEISRKTPVELERKFNSDKIKHLPTLGTLLETESQQRQEAFMVDNYFPFSSCDESTCNCLADISTISEFDSQSVLNLTD